MEPKNLRKKKNSNRCPKAQFPIISTISGPYKFTGTYNGCTVFLEKQSEMEKVHMMGFFGKASLSRSFPTFNNKEIIILRQRQYDFRNNILEKYEDTFKDYDEKNVCVIDDSESDTEDYMKKLKPCLKKQKIPVVEHLCLLLEEAYFLMKEKECLRIQQKKGEFLDCETIWKLFSKSQNYFIASYAAYKYFRMRNWIVKSGLKFGGDFCKYCAY